MRRSARFGLSLSRCAAVRLFLLLALVAPHAVLADPPGSAVARSPFAGAPPATLISAAALGEPRFGQIAFEARDGKRLDALTYRGTGFDPRSGPIWFVVHGASRDVERYIAAAAPVAERHGALAIAVEFSKDHYPRGNDFTLGVIYSGRANAAALRERRWREPVEYLYSELEHLFDAVRSALGGTQPGYLLFGHSAGAQFTHRLLTFVPGARVLGAVAANAGWYTLPVGGADAAYAFPYGIAATPLTDADVRALLAAPLVMLLGERDTTTPAVDRMVRGTPQAMHQGAYRLARGQFYFATARERAAELEAAFNWQIATVPRARHSAAEMIGSAAQFLFSAEAPCTPANASAATQLVFTEILADPPPGQTGDANADGARDPQQDEFVEIVNNGAEPVCLTGWALGDVRDPERHVFPIGPALAPGAALVVFGGGVPTGSFGGATVQWAAQDGQLSLSNDGDVLSLRDARGRVVAQLSWGDCGGAECASEHLDRDLGIDGAIVRVGTHWQVHAAIADMPYSPGRQTDGRD